MSHDHAYLSVTEDEEEQEVVVATATTGTSGDQTNHHTMMNNERSEKDKSNVKKEAPPIPIDNNIINTTCVNNDEGTIASSFSSTHNPDNDDDIVFGSYDEVTNCITIYMPQTEKSNDVKSEPMEEDQVRIVKEETSAQQQQEMEQEDITSEQAMKSIATPLEPCLSPLSSLSLMDSGYQSLGSPDSDLWSSCGHTSQGDALDELWNDSFSELFPSLV